MQLGIKTAHKPVQGYYTALAEFEKHGIVKETSVRNAFQEVLTTYARKLKWSFIEEYGVTLANKNKGSVDGALLDPFSIVMGYWEAKDSNDDLAKEVKKKFDIGYPKSNILFQEPKRAILYQDGTLVDDYDLTNPDRLVQCLTDFFEYHEEEQANWTEIADSFKERIPESAKKLVEMIEEEKRSNKRFQTAFQAFATLCRASINPNLADAAIEEMLVQHLLTSRLFASVFNNPEFVRRNVIAAEIEKVVDALTSRNFNRDDFFRPLDHFYKALENRAKTITEWSEKQHFINTVYERFFQGFSVKIADTHGIVYTPQPIVDFMVKSVQHILKTEFGRSLADEGVHILDPFVGTGNFILRIIKEIAETQKTKLPKKYANELHCNEVMLLPYYIASMNIEHEYYSQTKDYKAFEGICLVDTFELAEPAQTTLFTTENSERVERQKKSPITVIIGNPPYNAWQQDEFDRSKNRNYPTISERVTATYVKGSSASLHISLKDPFVKAIRWASDRVGSEGVIAFVTNNSFVDNLAFDGMRKALVNEFDSLYILDLKGNIRKDSMRDGIPLGEQHTVFGLSAMVGISISVLVRGAKKSQGLQYFTVPFRSTRRQKFIALSSALSISGIDWESIQPTAKNTWLSEGEQEEFGTFLPMGSKSRGDKENAIFQQISNGIKTNRDDWAYGFEKKDLISKINTFIQTYSTDLNATRGFSETDNTFEQKLTYDASKIKWSDDLKDRLRKGKSLEFAETKIRGSLYRPFTKKLLYFDRGLNNSIYNFRKIFPTPNEENLLISVTDAGSEKPFMTLVADRICDLHLPSSGCGAQCFPFYTYDEDGSNRRENITDWALEEFRKVVELPSDIRRGAGGVYHVGDKTTKDPLGKTSRKAEGNRLKDSSALSRAGGVKGASKKGGVLVWQESSGVIPPAPAQVPDRDLTKWDIFYYVYGFLHHPEYRTKYAANLRRELPRIPLPNTAEDFWKLSEAGKKLAELHVNYEKQKEYDLKEDFKPGAGLNLRVEKMKLTKDKTAIVYNDDLTLRGIPPETFDYRLGNRSALDWIIDQYQVSTDKRSGITNDPNRPDDDQYILRLIKQVVTVSLETVEIVRGIGEINLQTT